MYNLIMMNELNMWTDMNKSDTTNNLSGLNKLNVKQAKWSTQPKTSWIN